MPALLIKNGRVIDPASGHDAVADVWIEDGLIKGVGSGLVARGRGSIRRHRLDRRAGLHRHARASARAWVRTLGEHRKRRAGGGGGRIHVHLPDAQYCAGERQPHRHHVHHRKGAAACGGKCFPIGAITRGSQGEELAAIGSMRQAGAVAISDDGRPGDERPTDAARHGVRAQLPNAGDQPLRGPASERGRRYARRRGIRAPGTARDSGLV